MKRGNCFHASADFLTTKCLFDKHAQTQFILVHGYPTLTVPPYIEYLHAWIEIGDEKVLDAEHGSWAPKDLFYAVGNIDPERCRRYTYAEMRRKINEHGHWGPWDLGPSPEEEELDAADLFEPERTPGQDPP
jgi:hypothetical protein